MINSEEERNFVSVCVSGERVVKIRVLVRIRSVKIRVLVRIRGVKIRVLVRIRRFVEQILSGFIFCLI